MDFHEIEIESLDNYENLEQRLTRKVSIQNNQEAKKPKTVQPVESINRYGLITL
jgi:hypothetical protein